MPFTPGDNPLPPPIDPVTIVLDIIGFILRLFGFGSVDLKPLADAVNTTWTNLVFTSTFLYNALRAFWDFARRLLITILDGLKHIISDILHGHLLQALKDIQALFHALHTIFQPIIDFINAVRAWYLKYILPYQKRIINIISAIRRIVEVFRLLGFKWATKLDADLQKIQGYVTASITAILGPLNTISTILGLIVDPGMIIRTSAFGGTLWNNLGLVKQAAGYGSQRPLYPDEKQAETDMHKSVYGPDPSVTTGADGTVRYDPALTVVDESMTQQARTLGIQP